MQLPSCKSAFRFSQFYLSKAVFVYVVRSPCLYSVRSLHFIPSPCQEPITCPCFIPSPQSVFRSPRFTLSGQYCVTAGKSLTTQWSRLTT